MDRRLARLAGITLACVMPLGGVVAVASPVGPRAASALDLSGGLDESAFDAALPDPDELRAAVPEMLASVRLALGSLSLALLEVAPPDADMPRIVRTAELFGTAAQASRVAARSRLTGTRVGVSQYGGIRPATVDRLERLAYELRIPLARVRGATVGMTGVWRDATPVQIAGAGGGSWRVPMSVTAMPIDLAGATMGFTASAALGVGAVVMGTTTAGLRGARVGDEVELVGPRGAVRRAAIGFIASDAVMSGAEIVLPESVADALGVTTTTRTVFYGSLDADRLIEALASAGYVDGDTVRIDRSDGPRNPDGLLGSARVKELLGEFAYRPDTDGAIVIDRDWEAANIVSFSHPGTGIRTRCHRVVTDDLAAAFDAVVEAGLAGAIDVRNTNTYGGCYNARLANASISVGSISRHSWGMAFDMNTTTNAQGAVPRLDCRVVRIFREHGFAWGGNFLVPDGMHMEWVGEPRHQLSYPSEYCPNAVPSGATPTGE